MIPVNQLFLLPDVERMWLIKLKKKKKKKRVSGLNERMTEAQGGDVRPRAQRGVYNIYFTSKSIVFY